jgi:exopolysaccharide biosynthesis polyprenyl glycosylphosphotransferase
MAGTAVARSKSKRPLRFRLYGVLLAVDLACILVSFVAGALIRFGEVFVDGWVGVTTSIMALFAVTAAATGAYSLNVLRHPSQGTMRVLGSLAMSVGLLLLLTYLLKVDPQISRIMTTSSFLLAFASIAIFRQLAGDTIDGIYKGAFTTDLLLADGTSARAPEGFIRIDASDVHLRPDPSDSSMLIRFAELLSGVDRVVVSCAREEAPRWAHMLKGANVSGEILNDDYDDLAPVGVSKLADRTTMVVSAGPLSLRQRGIKRVFDLAFTLPILFLLLPVLALVAIAIKLDSRGPVLFKQQRVGRGNALFEIFKFRTMSIEQTDLSGNVSASRDDPRTTRVGRFLRKTSIDELPQFFNVLTGSMSIVGPRPHALGSLAGEQLFWHIDERYWHRHALKPGITGLAQVRGFRGATQTREHLTTRLYADLEYIAGWSIARDLAILARTLRVVVHPQAY